MEIYELQRDLDRFFVSAGSAYAGYPMGRLMELAQQGDKDARLQVVVELKGLMYNSLKVHMAYIWLPEGDVLQILCETVLRELAVWDAADPKGFCTHLSHCFRNLIRNEVRRNCNHNGREISFDASAGERSPAEIELDGVVCGYFFDSDKFATQELTVRGLMGILTRRQRDVVLAALGNLGNSEIADKLDIDEGSVRRLKNRAIGRLQSFLAVSQKRGSALC